MSHGALGCAQVPPNSYSPTRSNWHKVLTFILKSSTEPTHPPPKECHKPTKIPALSSSWPRLEHVTVPKAVLTFLPLLSLTSRCWLDQHPKPVRRDEVSWFHNSSHPPPINRGPPRGRSNWRQGELSDPALLVPHLWSNPPALGTKPKLPTVDLKKISTAGKDGNETAKKKHKLPFWGETFDVGGC